jgi:hypothetical protein
MKLIEQAVMTTRQARYKESIKLIDKVEQVILNMAANGKTSATVDITVEKESHVDHVVNSLASQGFRVEIINSYGSKQQEIDISWDIYKE